MSPESTRGLARFALTAVVLAIIGILFVNSKYGIIFGKTGDYPHYIQTVVPQAFEVIPGERMVEGGQTVGEITNANVTRDGQAHIVMGLDDSGWPIPSDSVLTLRMGGTIKFTDRFIEVTKGHAGSYFAYNQNVPAKQFVTPVEYNSLFDIFNKQTRAGLQSMFANGGPTFSQAAQPLRQALPVAPPLLTQADAIFRDLGYDQAALSTLVSSTAQISDAVAASNPGVRTLIDGAANTFGTIASESKALQTILVSAGPAFHQDGVTFHHAAVDLYPVAKLADRLAPGINELGKIADPLNATLHEVVNIEPSAVHTLQTVTHSGPTIDKLLTSARTTLFPQLTAVGNHAAKELNCIRPFTPDIMGFLQGWGGFLGLGENHPRINFLHSYISILPLPNATPIDSVQAHALFPDLGVESVGVPGTSWNQPWYQPQCGVTADSFNPALDMNNGTYDPNGTKSVPYPVVH